MENTKKKKKSRRTLNTPRNPQQPGDQDHLETTRDKTRPTRYPILVRFHGSRVCGNRPRTALAFSTSTEVDKARRPHTCSRPCAFEGKKNTKKSAATNTSRNPQQPGERDHLETACDETRPTRSPRLARFYRSGVCGNPRRTALAISTISREVK